VVNNKNLKIKNSMNYKQFLSQVKYEAISLDIKTDEQLQLQIKKVKMRLENESLEKVMPEWFALVQEVSWRQLGLKHYETQLVAGLLLHEGKIVEMKTGEGKTLSSTLPVSLNALSGGGVHVVTVNEYLAERDKQWMSKVYRGLGLSVGLVKSDQLSDQKRKNYAADITYITNSELVFDYLRDSSTYDAAELVQPKSLEYCILDEIDSILIDEARTPLILSEVKGTLNIRKLQYANAVIQSLEKNRHFEIDDKRREIYLTEEGYEEIKKRLGKKSLYDLDDPWTGEIVNALKAKHIFKLNRDYIISANDEVLIVDEFTGRVMEDRRWSMGIHQAIEVKENVEVGDETQTKTAITYQNFFTLYAKLAGMTGTAKTAEKEFNDIYNLKVEVVPTSKPLIRKDLDDLVYQTELAKWKAVLKQAIECFQKGQPILIGTSNVEKSEFLSELFTASNIPHQVLNAKPENISRESEIVAQAGERSAVTIATNMAGRGTDIILGGNPGFKVKQRLKEFFITTDGTPPSDSELRYIEKVFKDYSEKNSSIILIEKLCIDIADLPYSIEESYPAFKNFYNFLLTKTYESWQIENKFVKEVGGLFVLGTERYETRRIDNQLRGRAGRQGDPGISQFFVSLEDELIQRFGGGSIKKLVESLLDDKNAPLQSVFLTKTLENAQKKVELYNYETRKNVFEYDSVINSHRKNLFRARKQTLLINDWYELFLRYQEVDLNPDIDTRVIKQKIKKVLYKIDLPIKKKYRLNYEKKCKKIWIEEDLRIADFDSYQVDFYRINHNIELLKVIDLEWSEHIERMNYIRDTISWRSYGQQNPLVEYNDEAFKSYKKMFRQIHKTLIHYFLTAEIFSEE